MRKLKAPSYKPIETTPLPTAREQYSRSRRVSVRKIILTLCVLTLSVLTLVAAASPAAFAQANPPASADVTHAIALYNAGKYSECSKLLKQVVNKTKTDQQAWYYLGLALIRKQQLKDATKALETALKLQPNSARAHVALAYALLLRNKAAMALNESVAAASIDPNLIDPHYVSGVAYLQLGKRELALQEAENVLKLDPAFANAHLLKSQALVRFTDDVLYPQEAEQSTRERYSQAGDALAKYLQLNPNAENKETWAAQLESLRFFATPRPGKSDGVYTSKEVTTRPRVLSKPEPAYTEIARNNGVIGRVTLRAVFAADGAVKHIIVVSGLPYGLTEAAIIAARKIKFVPAMLAARPVSMFIQLEYNFNLY
jgi:tetratricopeptide (TPR) repeat protein